MTNNYLGCRCILPALLATQNYFLLHHADLLVHVVITGENSKQPEPTSVNLFAACLYFFACRNASPAAALSFPATTGSCIAHTHTLDGNDTIVAHVIMQLTLYGKAGTKDLQCSVNNKVRSILS